MKIPFRIIAVPLLLGCALVVSSLVSARENSICESAGWPAGSTAGNEEMDIAICKAADELAYKVTNIGTIQLTNVRVTDEHLAKINCQQDVLNVGESMDCAAVQAETADISGTGCAVADHVEFSEAGVTVTTKGDCIAATN